jgi:hypothetical protein
MNMKYADYRKLFSQVAEGMWANAQTALKVAELQKLDTYWYNFYSKPLSLHQRYEFGYWLSFYIYQDLRHAARMAGDTSRVRLLDKAYYSGDWSGLLETGSK